MDKDFRKLIDITKEEMSAQSHSIAVANKIVAVSGLRKKLPLEGRNIDIVYYPAPDDDGAALAPLIVGYHGGGFVFGGCALDDKMWVAVSKALNVNIASVGYRMSPEYKWKDTLADAYDSYIYLKEHADEFGFDAEHISLMGQSAGGNLAAAVSILANSNGTARPDNVILVYPFLDIFTDPASKGPGSLEGPVCYAMNELHCEHEEANDPLVSPVFATAEMLQGLPDTILAVCEDDNLKYEGIEYGRKLKEAGVKVSQKEMAGMPHGFFESGFKTPTEFEYQFLGKNAEKIINDGSLFKSAEECLNFIKENFVR